MGSMIHIWRNHKDWILTGKEAILRGTGQHILEIEYGDAHWDYEGGSSPLRMWIRKSIYDNVATDKYKISKKLFCRELIIEDENSNEISPIDEGFIY